MMVIRDEHLKITVPERQLRNKRVAIAMIEYGLAELGWTP